MNLFTFTCICGYIFFLSLCKKYPTSRSGPLIFTEPWGYSYSILLMKVFFNTHFKWLSKSIPTLSTLRTLAIQWHNGNENVKKTIALLSKITTLRMHHTFLYISLLLCHYCDMKMPYFAFYGEHKLATMQFYFSFWTWIWSLGIWLLKRVCLYIWQRKWLRIIKIKTERMEIHFLTDVLIAIASLDLLKSLHYPWIHVSSALIGV